MTSSRVTVIVLSTMATLVGIGSGVVIIVDHFMK